MHVQHAVPLDESLASSVSRRGSTAVAEKAPSQDNEAVSPLQQDTSFFPRLSVDGPGVHAKPSPDDDAILPDMPRVTIMTSVVSSASNAVDHAMRKRRRSIQRQVRTLFIYPVAYIVMWLIPWISHCLSYNDYLALHPIFAVSLMSSTCQTLLGFVDATIFCLRERPWKHIPGSDGTFLGSFRFWEFCDGPRWARRRYHRNDANKRGTPPVRQQSESDARLLSNIVPHRGSTPRGSASAAAPSRPVPLPKASWHVRNFSSDSDQKTMEKALAQQRLAAEREEWKRLKASQQQQGTRRSVGSTNDATAAAAAAPPGQRNWFDMHLDIDDADLAVANERSERERERYEIGR